MVEAEFQQMQMLMFIMEKIVFMNYFKNMENDNQNPKEGR
jgi:hypothetical protein